MVVGGLFELRDALSVLAGFVGVSNKAGWTLYPPGAPAPLEPSAALGLILIGAAGALALIALRPRRRGHPKA